MKIAFDVKGTLDGPKGVVLLEAFMTLQSMGHECIVWSNSLGYAHDCVKTNGLMADFCSKKMMLDYESDDEIIDVCVEDDRSQTWLGSKQFVWVDELTMEPDEIVALILQRATEPRSER